MGLFYYKRLAAHDLTYKRLKDFGIMKIAFEILIDKSSKASNPYQGIAYGCAFYIKTSTVAENERWLDKLPAIFNNPQACYDDCRAFNLFIPVDYSFVGIVAGMSDSITLFKWLFKQPDVDLIAGDMAYFLTVLCTNDRTCIRPILSLLSKNSLYCVGLRDMMLSVRNGNSVDSSRRDATTVIHDRLCQLIGRGLKGIDPVYWDDSAIEFLMLHLEERMYTLEKQEGTRMAQIPYLNTKIDCLAAESDRIRASFALHLISHKGIMIDEREIHKLRARLVPKLHGIEAKLVAAGFAYYKNDQRSADGRSFSLIHKDNKAIQQYLSTQPNASKTKGGSFEMSAEALLKSQHPALVEYAGFKDNHLIKTYLPFLIDALASEDHVIHPNFSHYSETGRVNGRDPNLLNLPREGGIRNCFMAREGYCFVFADYDGAEMRTFAQALVDIVGHSKLAEKYQADTAFDPHSYLVAEFMGLSYNQVIERKNQNDRLIKQTRQLMKAANFGFMGGLSSSNFGAYARERYGVGDVSAAKAMELYGFYMKVFPEVKAYFSWVKAQTMNPDGVMDVVLPRSLRISGGKQFTQACNCFAQGVAADGALRALYSITEKCFDSKSVLYRARPILFIHDEIITEVPLENAVNAASEIQTIMQAGMEYYTPDIPSACSVALADRWYEEADTIYDKNGILTLWTPSKK